MTNCPRCNMFLAQGAQVCPNCQLNLMQYSFPQGNPVYAGSTGGNEMPESKKESVYRKILIGICFFLFAEVIINHVSDWLDMGFMYTAMKPLRYLSQLVYAGLPLFIALVIPKKSSLRVLLIILSSIYALISLWYWIYYEFLYYSWSEPDYIDYQF